MAEIDLTPFGFTPTESAVYGVLLSTGRSTGYAVARAAGLARANTYSALEGLVLKGGARSEPGPPRRYRAEAPEALLARLHEQQGAALDRLSEALEAAAAPDVPAIVELTSPRGLLQLLSHDVARARTSIRLLAPPDAFPLLAPALRRAVGAGVTVTLASTGPVALDFAPVSGGRAAGAPVWPGTPIVAVVDDARAVLAAATGASVSGYWTSSPPLVAAARVAFDSFRSQIDG